MARFIRIPPLRIGDSGQWILDGECVYESEYTLANIRVPEGFETDLASIPKWVPRRIADPAGKSRAPAIVHDWLCRKKIGPRSRADKIFLEAMEVTGVPWWRRRLMYRAVTLLTFWLKVQGKAK